jgi:hypothetical protein
MNVVVMHPGAMGSAVAAALEPLALLLAEDPV